MREDRLAGRLRNFVLVDTANMIGDGLTKAGIFPQLMQLNTWGGRVASGRRPVVDSRWSTAGGRRHVISLEEYGQYLIPIDHFTDCNDFWELTCEQEGIPSDKSQRLAILAMREDRLAGRLRNFVLVDTANMIGDGLTKAGIFPQSMQLNTWGGRVSMIVSAAANGLVS